MIEWSRACFARSGRLHISCLEQSEPAFVISPVDIAINEVLLSASFLNDGLATNHLLLARCLSRVMIHHRAVFTSVIFLKQKAMRDEYQKGFDCYEHDHDHRMQFERNGGDGA